MLATRIVDRYLLAECVKTWLGVIAVLVVLTLGVGFARFIGKAAAGELPAGTVLAVAAFSALENMEIVLPVSLLLAIMLTVGRLCRDNEMAALSAGGLGLAQLYRPFMVFAFLLAAIATWLSLSVAPKANVSMALLSQQFGIAAQLQAFEPGRFHTLMNGRAAFYAETVNQDTGNFESVFIRFRNEKEIETVVTAKTAAQQRDKANGKQTLVLRDGWRYEGVPGQADYRVIRFAEHGVRVDPPTQISEYDLAETDSASLFFSDDVQAKAELQRRLGIPASLLILALLALPLGHLPPRAGRYGKLIIGIALYLAYANSLRLAEVWLVQGRTPEIIGVWWVHALMLSIALILIGRRQYIFRRIFSGRSPANNAATAV